MEVISQCHTHFGRLNSLGESVEMMKWQRDHAVPAEKAGELPAEQWNDKFTIGVLVDKELPNFLDEYEKVKQYAKELESEPKQE